MKGDWRLLNGTRSLRKRALVPPTMTHPSSGAHSEQSVNDTQALSKKKILKFAKGTLHPLSAQASMPTMKQEMEEFAVRFPGNAASVNL